jgi:hypothetical protein
MTMPNERTRSLRFAHETLQEASVLPALEPGDREGALQLLQTYPDPATVRQWIDADRTCIPAEAAEAIERAGALLRRLQLSRAGGEDFQRSLLFALRHLPAPGEARRHMKPLSWQGSIQWWLLPEDHYR